MFSAYLQLLLLLYKSNTIFFFAQMNIYNTDRPHVNILWTHLMYLKPSNTMHLISIIINVDNYEYETTFCFLIHSLLVLSYSLQNFRPSLPRNCEVKHYIDLGGGLHGLQKCILMNGEVVYSKEVVYAAQELMYINQ